MRTMPVQYPNVRQLMDVQPWLKDKESLVNSPFKKDFSLMMVERNVFPVNNLIKPTGILAPSPFLG